MMSDEIMPIEAVSKPDRRFAALWRDPAPRTFEGARLWDYLKMGISQPGRDDRDIGQRICQIEDEASRLDEDAMRLSIMRALEQTDNPHSPWTAFAAKVMDEYNHRSEWDPKSMPSRVECECWRCMDREPDDTLHGVDIAVARSGHVNKPWNETNPEWWKSQVQSRGEIAWDWLVNEWAARGRAA